jgi:microcystin-dependent protein
MSDPFVAEIRIFGFNFAPTGWAQCSGQLLPISQNTALFSLLGTYYGGDGRVTFALPNLNGSVPIHVGGNQPGPGLSTYDLGQTGGEEYVTLNTTEMPVSHSHALVAQAQNASLNAPSGQVLAEGRYGTPQQGGAVNFYTTVAPDTQLNPMAASLTGGNQPHNNIMPSLTLRYCIAMQGIYPQRP